MICEQACVQWMRKATEGGCIKTISETRPTNVTPFVLEGCWALDRLDQPTMRWLSRIAKQKHVAVADVIYEAIESFLAKWEAEAELETKIIKFPASLKR
jgi:hypothetical protein